MRSQFESWFEAFVRLNPSAKEDLNVAMTISFPNQSRSFDSTRNAVRFWGYDSAMETSFFITADALRRLCPGAGNNEVNLLKVFDSNRDLILMTASRLYVRGQRGSYDLIASDFAHPRR